MKGSRRWLRGRSRNSSSSKSRNIPASISDEDQQSSTAKLVAVKARDSRTVGTTLAGELPGTESRDDDGSTARKVSLSTEREDGSVDAFDLGIEKTFSRSSHSSRMVGRIKQARKAAARHVGKGLVDALVVTLDSLQGVELVMNPSTASEANESVARVADENRNKKASYIQSKPVTATQLKVKKRGLLRKLFGNRASRKKLGGKFNSIVHASNDVAQVGGRPVQHPEPENRDWIPEQLDSTPEQLDSTPEQLDHKAEQHDIKLEQLDPEADQIDPKLNTEEETDEAVHLTITSTRVEAEQEKEKMGKDEKNSEKEHVEPVKEQSMETKPIKNQEQSMETKLIKNQEEKEITKAGQSIPEPDQVEAQGHRPTAGTVTNAGDADERNTSHRRAFEKETPDADFVKRMAVFLSHLVTQRDSDDTSDEPSDSSKNCRANDDEQSPPEEEIETLPLPRDQDHESKRTAAESDKESQSTVESRSRIIDPSSTSTKREKKLSQKSTKATKSNANDLTVEVEMNSLACKASKEEELNDSTKKDDNAMPVLESDVRELKKRVIELSRAAADTQARSGETELLLVASEAGLDMETAAKNQTAKTSTLYISEALRIIFDEHFSGQAIGNDETIAIAPGSGQSEPHATQQPTNFSEIPSDQNMLTDQRVHSNTGAEEELSEDRTRLSQHGPGSGETPPKNLSKAHVEHPKPMMPTTRSQKIDVVFDEGNDALSVRSSQTCSQSRRPTIADRFTKAGKRRPCARRSSRSDDDAAGKEKIFSREKVVATAQEEGIEVSRQASFLRNPGSMASTGNIGGSETIQEDNRNSMKVPNLAANGMQNVVDEAACVDMSMRGNGESRIDGLDPVNRMEGGFEVRRQGTGQSDFVEDESVEVDLTQIVDIFGDDSSKENNGKDGSDTTGIGLEVSEQGAGSRIAEAVGDSVLKSFSNLSMVSRRDDIGLEVSEQGAGSRTAEAVGDNVLKSFSNSSTGSRRDDKRTIQKFDDAKAVGDNVLKSSSNSSTSSRRDDKSTIEKLDDARDILDSAEDISSPAPTPNSSSPPTSEHISSVSTNNSVDAADDANQTEAEAGARQSNAPKEAPKTNELFTGSNTITTEDEIQREIASTEKSEKNTKTWRKRIAMSAAMKRWRSGKKPPLPPTKAALQNDDQTESLGQLKLMGICEKTKHAAMDSLDQMSLSEQSNLSVRSDSHEVGTTEGEETNEGPNIEEETKTVGISDVVISSDEVSVAPGNVDEDSLHSLTPSRLQSEVTSKSEDAISSTCDATEESPDVVDAAGHILPPDTEDESRVQEPEEVIDSAYVKQINEAQPGFASLTETESDDIVVNEVGNVPPRDLDEGSVQHRLPPILQAEETSKAEDADSSKKPDQQLACDANADAGDASESEQEQANEIEKVFSSAPAEENDGAISNEERHSREFARDEPGEAIDAVNAKGERNQSEQEILPVTEEEADGAVSHIEENKEKKHKDTNAESIEVGDSLTDDAPRENCLVSESVEVVGDETILDNERPETKANEVEKAIPVPSKKNVFPRCRSNRSHLSLPVNAVFHKDMGRREHLIGRASSDTAKYASTSRSPRHYFAFGRRSYPTNDCTLKAVDKETREERTCTDLVEKEDSEFRATESCNEQRESHGASMAPITSCDKEDTTSTAVTSTIRSASPRSQRNFVPVVFHRKKRGDLRIKKTIDGKLDSQQHDTGGSGKKTLTAMVATRKNDEEKESCLHKRQSSVDTTENRKMDNCRVTATESATAEQDGRGTRNSFQNDEAEFGEKEVTRECLQDQVETTATSVTTAARFNEPTLLASQLGVQSSSQKTKTWDREQSRVKEIHNQADEDLQHDMLVPGRESISGSMHIHPRDEKEKAEADLVDQAVATTSDETAEAVDDHSALEETPPKKPRPDEDKSGKNIHPRDEKEIAEADHVEQAIPTTSNETTEAVDDHSALEETPPKARADEDKSGRKKPSSVGILNDVDVEQTSMAFDVTRSAPTASSQGELLQKKEFETGQSGERMLEQEIMQHNHHTVQPELGSTQHESMAEVNLKPEVEDALAGTVAAEVKEEQVDEKPGSERQKEEDAEEVDKIICSSSPKASSVARLARKLRPFFSTKKAKKWAKDKLKKSGTVHQYVRPSNLSETKTGVIGAEQQDCNEACDVPVSHECKELNAIYVMHHPLPEAREEQEQFDPCNAKEEVPFCGISEKRDIQLEALPQASPFVSKPSPSSSTVGKQRPALLHQHPRGLNTMNIHQNEESVAPRAPEVHSFHEPVQAKDKEQEITPNEESSHRSIYRGNEDSDVPAHEAAIAPIICVPNAPEETGMTGNDSSEPQKTTHVKGIDSEEDITIPNNVQHEKNAAPTNIGLTLSADGECVDARLHDTNEANGSIGKIGEIELVSVSDPYSEPGRNSAPPTPKSPIPQLGNLLAKTLKGVSIAEGTMESSSYENDAVRSEGMKPSSSENGIECSERDSRSCSSNVAVSSFDGGNEKIVHSETNPKRKADHAETLSPKDADSHPNVETIMFGAEESSVMDRVQTLPSIEHSQKQDEEDTDGTGGSVGGTAKGHPVGKSCKEESPKIADHKDDSLEAGARKGEPERPATALLPEAALKDHETRSSNASQQSPAPSLGAAESKNVPEESSSPSLGAEVKPTPKAPPEIDSKLPPLTKPNARPAESMSSAVQKPQDKGPSTDDEDETTSRRSLLMRPFVGWQSGNKAKAPTRKADKVEDKTVTEIDNKDPGSPAPSLGAAESKNVPEESSSPSLGAEVKPTPKAPPEMRNEDSKLPPLTKSNARPAESMSGAVQKPQDKGPSTDDEDETTSRRSLLMRPFVGWQSGNKDKAPRKADKVEDKTVTEIDNKDPGSPPSAVLAFASAGKNEGLPGDSIETAPPVETYGDSIVPTLDSVTKGKPVHSLDVDASSERARRGEYSEPAPKEHSMVDSNSHARLSSKDPLLVSGGAAEAVLRTPKSRDNESTEKVSSASNDPLSRGDCATETMLSGDKSASRRGKTKLSSASNDPLPQGVVDVETSMSTPPTSKPLSAELSSANNDDPLSGKPTPSKLSVASNDDPLSQRGGVAVGTMLSSTMSAPPRSKHLSAKLSSVSPSSHGGDAMKTVLSSPKSAPPRVARGKPRTRNRLFQKAKGRVERYCGNSLRRKHDKIQYLISQTSRGDGVEVTNARGSAKQVRSGRLDAKPAAKHPEKRPERHPKRRPERHPERRPERLPERHKSFSRASLSTPSSVSHLATHKPSPKISRSPTSSDHLATHKPSPKISRSPTSSEKRSERRSAKRPERHYERPPTLIRTKASSHLPSPPSPTLSSHPSPSPISSHPPPSPTLSSHPPPPRSSAAPSPALTSPARTSPAKLSTQPQPPEETATIMSDDSSSSSSQSIAYSNEDEDEDVLGDVLGDLINEFCPSLGFKIKTTANGELGDDISSSEDSEYVTTGSIARRFCFSN